ncbi:DsbA family protein [Corynebacterium aquilae]|uniref:DSBA oxidoreductase n=1 Tax=Corynebacterium aquilae DSM 44791 TaxID=1431546 RepID=A0A1L7CHC6_9CORY|nr:DsbA family protein [Corynebacterium aquilae]APT85270.1 DSBA oxidoreductase [Corynebacterium aquilae DSM 44791]
MSTQNNAQAITFYFDVSCPFCWVTSRWIKEVEKVRDVAVTFAPMSLFVLNEGREELPADYREKMKANLGPARVFSKVAVEAPDKVDELYTVMGHMVHNEGNGGRKDFGGYNDIIARAVEKVGLDAEFAAVADSDEYDEQLRKFHATAMEKVGNDVGTPVIQLGERAFFGPVLTRIPRGETAGELFDAALTLGTYPHFFELKRSRDEMPSFD